MHSTSFLKPQLLKGYNVEVANYVPVYNNEVKEKKIKTYLSTPFFSLTDIVLNLFIKGFILSLFSSSIFFTAKLGAYEILFLESSTKSKKYVLSIKEVKENVEEKYILCYFLGEKQFYWDYVRKIVEKTKYKVKVIPMTRKSYLKKYDIEVATGPIEFLSLINNAKIICTDSFHGMVFSLIFNKNFSALSRFDSKDSKSQNSRIESLLNMLDLKENMIYEDYSNVQYEVNNYEKVNEIMQEKIKLSQDFIINAINNR